MKKLFTAIRKGDLKTVEALLSKDPALISCTAKQPPKKDAGQSPLQVAIKTGQLEIADFLLDRGADVNFMEAEGCASPWRMPVLQDAITAAILCSRWNTVGPGGSIEVFSTQAQADRAYGLLDRIIGLGADIACRDSFGNTCLERAILSAAQILPGFNHSTKEIMNDRILTPELRSDLTRIFTLLFDAGADRNALDRIQGKPLVQVYRDQPVGVFLNI